MADPPLEAAIDVTVSDDVEFTFRVTNVGTNPLDLTFPSGQLAELIVERDGAEVWRLSDGRLFTQALQTRTVEPDEALTVSAHWSAPEPGRYRVTGSLEARNMDAQASATFVV